MFTVKWVAPNGCQHLYPDASSISYMPASYTPASENTVSGKAQVQFDLPGIGSNCSIESGRIYIMNEDGRTVERYILEGDAEFPHGLAPAA